MSLSQRIQNRLNQASPALFASYAIIAAFSTYFSMYAFRKPFAAGVYADYAPIVFPFVGTIKYKTLLIITQVLGYCLSKFMGIKVISELPGHRRAQMLLGCIGVAWGSLFLFALIPAPYNVICLFFNGLPLGMVWGLTFGFLEGRRLSEILGVGLSASYILASSVVKGIGVGLVSMGVPEIWMPFATGGLFVLPMGLFVFLLASMPPPSEEDIMARSERAPMDREKRIAFFKSFSGGLIPLTVLYVLLTAYRDFRDNFSVEIWKELGYSKSEVTALLAGSEIPVTVGVLGILALLMVIKDNRKALMAVHLIMMGGTALVGLSTLLFQWGIIGPILWMILIGLGLYAAYVPYGCILFDRLIAAVGVVGTAGFLIYVTDAFGYLGSVLLMLYKDLGQHQDQAWLDFFIAISYVTSGVCTLFYLISFIYFRSSVSINPTDPTST